MSIRTPRVGDLEFVVKVIAASASLIPFIASIETLKKDLNPGVGLLLDDPRFFAMTFFGVAYAATSDVRATAIATVISIVVLRTDQPPPRFFQTIREGFTHQFPLGYGSVVGLSVDDAARANRHDQPQSPPGEADSLDADSRPGRIQLMHGSR